MHPLTPFKVFAQCVAALLIAHSSLMLFPAAYMFFRGFEPHHGCKADSGERMAALYIFAGTFLFSGYSRQLRQMLPRSGLRVFWLGAASYYTFPMAFVLGTTGWDQFLRSCAKGFSFRFTGHPIWDLLQICVLVWPIAAAASLLMAVFSLPKESTEVYSQRQGAEWPRGLWAFVAVIVVTAAVLAFRDICSSERIYHESRRAGSLIGMLQLLEASSPDVRMTNTLQVLMATYPEDAGRLSALWRDYRVRVGKHHEERFAFMPPGVRLPPMEGEVLFVSGRPYRDHDGQSVRTIVSQEGKGYNSFRVRTVPENRFQQMCGRAGIPIPKPLRAPRTRLVLPPNRLGEGTK